MRESKSIKNIVYKRDAVGDFTLPTALVFLSSLIRTLTVGSGLTPDLLTFSA